MYFKATEEIFGVWISQTGSDKFKNFRNIFTDDYSTDFSEFEEATRPPPLNYT
jgi:hypothetical protein